MKAVAMEVACEFCGYTGLVGVDVVPYLVDRKGKKGSVRLIYRWLCGIQTGRDCSEKWHQKYREWRKARDEAIHDVPTR